MPSFKTKFGQRKVFQNEMHSRPAGAINGPHPRHFAPVGSGTNFALIFARAAMTPSGAHAGIWEPTHNRAVSWQTQFFTRYERRGASFTRSMIPSAG
jgi:hypothetical protein